MEGSMLQKAVENSENQVAIYTDGACSGNPGPGGWGAVLLYRGRRLEIRGNARETTNNRMELQAVIEALQRLKRPCVVALYSDSTYVIHAFTKGWLANWKLKGWQRGKGKPVLNMDLWKTLDQLEQTHTIQWHWVKGHADNPENNRCDELARKSIAELV